ncbi:YopX family protein [Parvimonas micra]|uniref:YopX family protein n=1 Tax=Parvimonas micra TaxID=33033 RepID=UPI00241FD7E9|nr:YopX family protein [Parvimonas micra]
MNNLRFRVWDKKRKLLRKVFYIDFENKGLMYFYNKDTGLYANFEDVEIMQSTGYKDKKGTEIFIGDIVKIYVEDREEHKVYYALCKVVFDEETLTTKLEIIERFCDILMPPKYLYFKNVEDIVIAGNIYENKELLG